LGASRRSDLNFRASGGRFLKAASFQIPFSISELLFSRFVNFAAALAFRPFRFEKERVKSSAAKTCG
jgi:hypothetical protein